MIALASSATLAHADSAAADDLAKAAEALAASGDFPGAAAKYRDAYRQSPRPDLMCNVGVAYYKAKDLPRAHRYLDQCVTTGASLDRDFIGNVKMVLTAVEQKLATGDYKPLNFIIEPQSATTTFASGVHDEPLVGSRQIWVPFGAYRVTIHAEGFTDRVLDITAENRDRADHGIKLEPSTSLPRPTEPRDNTRVGDPLPPPPPPAAERSFVAPIIASAATGVAGGLALGFYLAARGSASEAGRAATNEMYTDAADDAEGRQRISWMIGGVAAVGAVTAGVLWYLALRKPAPVEISASRGGAGLSLVGRW